jgi:hypothetical protein
MDFVKPPRWSEAEADQRLLVALRLQIENWLMTEVGQSLHNPVGHASRLCNRAEEYDHAGSIECDPSVPKASAVEQG